MVGTIDRVALKNAQRLFEFVGLCLYEVQIYGRAHPRSEKAKDVVVAEAAKYFERSGAGKTVAYHFSDSQVEFRRLPLIHLTAHGERLKKTAERLELGALQLQKGISAAQVDALMAGLAAKQRSQLIEPAAAGQRAATDADGFRLYTVEEANALALARDASLSAGGGGLFGVSVPEFLVSTQTFESVLSAYCALFSDLENDRTFDYAALQGAADRVVDLFSDSNGEAPLPTRSYFDDFTFHHSVNVSLIATKVASRLVSDRDILSKLSLSALLHDVGKMRIPVEIIYKPSRLTEAEFRCLQAHPSCGAEMLLGVDGVDPMCVAVAFGHHLSPEMTSYPKTRPCYGTDWVTELISVVDIYEALTAVRPYKQALSPEKAIRVMYSMPALNGRLPLVRLVYDAEGSYPVGSIVELTTGERGVVLARNPSSPDKPRLRLLTDRARNTLPHPVDLDLSAPPAPGAEPAAIACSVVTQDASANPLTMGAGPEPTEIRDSSHEDGDALMTEEG